MAKRKKTGPQLDPAILSKEKASLVRKNRQVILLNDRELDALNAYCSRFKVRSKAAAIREILMTNIINELEDNHPTLF